MRRCPILLVLALFSTGCAKEPQKSAASDAAAPVSSNAPPSSAPDAAVAREPEPARPSDATLRVVAESHERHVRAFVSGGRTIFAVGPLLYEGRADGSLRAVADAAALASVFPAEESMSGYAGTTTMPRSVARMPTGAVVATYDDKTTIAIEDGKGKPADAEIRSVVTWKGAPVSLTKEGIVTLPTGSGKARALPAKHAAIEATTTADGALVVLATNAVGRTVTLVYRDADEPKTAPFTAPGTCRLAPSFDGGAVARCANTYLDEEEYVERTTVSFQRFDGTKWIKAYTAAPRDASAGSVTSKGDLVVVSGAKHDVLRCPQEGKCAPVTTDAAVPEKTSTPHYVEVVTDAMDQNATKSWRTVKVDMAYSDGAVYESAVVAKSDDDIWVVTSKSGRTVLLHSSDKKERVDLPTRVDARVMARNAREPARWTGHCDHVFVRLPGTSAEPHAKRAADIRAAIVQSNSDDAYYYGPQVRWSLVEGKLGGSSVTGIVLIRPDVEAPIASLERTAERLADKFATGPASKPAITCTLPVLERLLLSGP